MCIRDSSHAGFKLYRHIFSQNETEEVADIKVYVEDAGIYYNSLGVDPVSGEVYFATLKGYADYKTNDIAIFEDVYKRQTLPCYINWQTVPGKSWKIARTSV